MVISQSQNNQAILKNIRKARIRLWRVVQIHRMNNFRECFEQDQKQEKQETKDCWKKVQQHMDFGKSGLGLADEYMRKFNQSIVEEIKKGKSPQEILRLLIGENSKK